MCTSHLATIYDYCSRTLTVSLNIYCRMDTSKIHSTIEAYDLTTDQWQTEIDTTMELLYPPVASLQ